MYMYLLFLLLFLCCCTPYFSCYFCIVVLHLFLLIISDHHINRVAQDCSPFTSRSSGSQARPLLRIWSSSTLVAHGNLCAHCSLAGLHLVCNRQCWETNTTRAKNRLARWALSSDSPTLHKRVICGTHNQIQVHYSPLLHIQQPYKCGVWERLTKYEFWEGLLYMCDAHRM